MTWLEVIMNNAAPILSTMPQQTQRNLWGAFGRLTSAIVDIPVGRLQGRRSLEDARRNVELAKINAEASAIKTEQEIVNKFKKEALKAATALFSKDETAQRVFAGMLGKGFIAQHREETTLRMAMQDLIDNPPHEDAKKEIDKDIVDAVLRKSSEKNDEDVRGLFARILAGEIRSPGSFSLRTINALDLIDKPTLDLFLRACSLSADGPTTGKIITDPFGFAGDNNLATFGLRYEQLVELSDADLININFSAWQEIPSTWLDFSLPFTIGSETYRMSRLSSSSLGTGIRVQGPSLSRIGRELKTIAPMVTDIGYVKGVSEWLLSKGIILNRVA